MSVSYKPYPGALLNPCADPTFKILFTSATEQSHKALTCFLSDVIGKEVTDVTLQPNELSGESFGDKQSEFDINCKIDGQFANIELQGQNVELSFGLRAEYHVAHLLNHYTPKGMDWADLPRVYQISVLNFVFDKDEKECVNLYQMQNKNLRKVGDRLNIIFLELPKIKKLPDDVSKLTKTQMWGKFFLYASKQEKRDFMEKLCEEREGIKMAADVLSFISQDEINWSRETHYWMKVSDEVTKKNAEIRALKKAKEDGIEEGREEGLRLTAKNFLKENVPVEIIAKCTGLTVEEIENLGSNG